MPYATEAAIRAHAPQAPATAVFTPYIEYADGIVDSILRDLFVVPFTDPDQVILNAANLIASGRYLISAYSKRSDEPYEYGESLVVDGRKLLLEIREDPTLVSHEVRDRTSDEEEDSPLLSAGDGMTKFTSDDPREWGR